MDDVAAEMSGHGGEAVPDRREFGGGDSAPATATYESVNLFGRRTGHRISAREGEILPPLPRGFTWVIPDLGSDR